MRGAHYAVALASIALVACGSNRPSAATESDAGSDGEVDPEAQLTPEELAALGGRSLPRSSRARARTAAIGFPTIRARPPLGKSSSSRPRSQESCSRAMTTAVPPRSA